MEEQPKTKQSAQSERYEIPQFLSLDEVAVLAGLSTRQIRRLMDDGVLSRTSEKKFPFVKTVKALIDYFKAQTSGSAVNKYKAAKAELAEMKVKEAKKLLLRREAMEYGINKIASIVTEKANDAPEALATLVAMKDVEECAETIRTYMAQMLGAMRANIDAEFGKH